MSAADDDDALTWEGDEPSRAASAPAALPKGFAAVGRGADGVARIEDDGSVTMPGGPAPTSNAVLVTLGVLGGIHLLWAAGWLIAGLRLLPVAPFLVTPAGGSTPPLWQAGTVLSVALAVAAPLVWFVAALVLTRATRAWVRIVVLLAGVVLLVPWPFVSVGAVGS